MNILCMNRRKKQTIPAPICVRNKAFRWLGIIDFMKKMLDLYVNSFVKKFLIMRLYIVRTAFAMILRAGVSWQTGSGAFLNLY